MFSLSELEFLVAAGGAPTLAEMPRRRLEDKGIAGPTAAHVIEEIHTPLNFAYLSFTTGSSAFQNIVGVTYAELPERIAASREVLDRCALAAGAGVRMLVTYAPLINVFCPDALKAHGVAWFFLMRSSRDALLLALCKETPDVVLGESSFLRLALDQAIEMGLQPQLPKRLCLITAGTPLDLDLLATAKKLGYAVHDLYGCQEFGWLTLDGVPLRDDITLIRSPAGADFCEVAVGGLPMGDSFPLSQTGHVCDKAGRVLTYKRVRTHPEYEVIVRATTRASRELVERTARTILRIKSRIVKVADDLRLNAQETELELVPSIVPGEGAVAAEERVRIHGSGATRLFERMLEAQSAFQSSAKTDPTWIKRR